MDKNGNKILMLLLLKYLNQDVKIPPIKKKMIVMIKLKTGNKHKGNSQLGTFFDITEFTTDRIDNDNLFN